MAEISAPYRRLSAEDSLLWRIESDPVLRSPILVVGLLDRVPRRKRLQATMERASRTIVDLRHRLVDLPGFLGRPWWAHDDDFCLDHHLRWVGAVGGGVRGVLDLTEPDVTTPFDPHRPPWSLTVVEGLDGTRAAFALRFHHAITDGIGGLHLAARIFDPCRHPDDEPAPDHEDEAGPLRWGDRLADGIDVLLDGVGRAATAARHPASTAAGSLEIARSIGRLLALPPPGSPLLAGRGLDRRLHVMELPLSPVRAAARAAHGTINDLLLAAVAGAFRTYHRQHGVPVPTMTVTMPVNVRRPGEPGGGNRFAPTRFVLPVDEPDPVVRTRIIGAIARQWRNEPALNLTGVLAAGLQLLPGSVVTRLFRAMLRSIDADVVDLPGLSQPIYMGGARVDRLWAFAPPTGAAFSVTLLTHLDTCCVAVACDRAAVTNPELLTNSLESSFDELLALAPPRSVQVMEVA